MKNTKQVFNKWMRAAGYKKQSGRWDWKEVEVDLYVFTMIGLLTYMLFLAMSLDA